MIILNQILKLHYQMKKINSDEEYRNKNLDQLLIEQKEWELRKNNL